MISAISVLESWDWLSVSTKINKPYSLKSSDAVLTELGYDDINKLETKVGNQLIRTLIGA